MRQHVERPANQPGPSLAELAHPSSALCGIDNGAGRSLEHRMIGASAEGGSFAGHDEHAAFAIVADGMQMALEIEDDVFVEAISSLGPVERDRRDRTVILDQEILSRLARRHS